MRYIALHALRLPDGWLDKAQKAYARASGVAAALENENDPLRRDKILKLLSKAIKSKQSLWTELKPHLADLSEDKCWYCECRQERSHMSVDHFRPKSDVAGCANHCGYWWLAFSWENFRLACQFCNALNANEEAGESLGKWAHFPLLFEADRAYGPNDDLLRETPILLDPIKGADVKLLWFDSNGAAVPKFDSVRHPRLHTRAAESVRILNLNDERIREQRRAIFVAVKSLIDEGSRAFDAYANGNVYAKRLFERVVADLEEMRADKAEYSSAAKAAIARYRDRDWVEQLL